MVAIADGLKTGVQVVVSPPATAADGLLTE